MLEDKMSEKKQENEIIKKLKDYKSFVGTKVEYTQKLFLRSVVEHPIRHCLIQWGILFLIGVFVFLQGYFSFAEFGINDFVITSEEDTTNFLAVAEASELLEEALALQELNVIPRSEELFDISFSFLFESSSGDLLTPENVQEMCEVEDLVLNQSRYKEYCFTLNPLGSNTPCVPEIFTVKFAYYRGGPCGPISQEAIDNAILLPETIAFMFNNFANPTVMRSLILLGGPLGADSAPNEDFDEVFETFDDVQVTDGYDLLWTDFLDDLFDFFGLQDRALRPAFFTTSFSRSGKDLLVRTGGSYLDSEEFQKVITVDQGLSAGSYLVVLIFMSVYMRTCLLPCLSMLAILFSMAVGLFLFSGILQIIYFTPLSILVLFIIAGIGADNVFVLYDAWRQCEEEITLKDILELREREEDKKEEVFTEEEQVKEVLFQRLFYAYSRASLSVSQTASTTFIAFLATGSSPITVIAGLGIYAAMVIISNLWFMFTIHPVNLMFYHYVLVMKFKYVLLEEEQFQEEEEEEEEEAEEKDLKKEKDMKEVELETDEIKDVERSNAQNKKVLEEEVTVENEDTVFMTFKKNCTLENILDNYLRLINETYFPHASLAVVLILVSVMLDSTLKLETPSTLESNFPEGHMLSDYTVDFNNLFTSGTPDSFTRVQGVFGVETFEVTARNRFAVEDLGDVVFDEDFEIFSNESQSFILRVCEELPLLPCNEGGCQQNTLLLQETGVLCFIEAFKTFIGTLSPAITESFVDENIDGAISSNEEFIGLVEDFLNTTAGSDFNDLVGLIDGEIKFLILEYRMSMIRDQPLKIKEPVVELFDEFTEKVRADATEGELEGLDTFFQSSFDHVWQHTEAAFVSGLFSGLFISLVASFFVLLIGTKNPRVSFFAIGGVASVVISVLGSAQFIGLALGTAESVAGVFVIGLAVDYIVHLGHLFMHSRHFLPSSPNPGPPENRPLWWYKCFYQTGDEIHYNQDMLNFSVKKMGGTVIAGAITTFGAAAFLSICTFAFFRKMSALLMFTILYSVSYAFLYFVPMLKLFGPGRRGNKLQSGLE